MGACVEGKHGGAFPLPRPLLWPIGFRHQVSSVLDLSKCKQFKHHLRFLRQLFLGKQVMKAPPSFSRLLHSTSFSGTSPAKRQTPTA